MVRSLSNKVSDLALKDVYGRFVKFVDEHAIERNGKLVVPERRTVRKLSNVADVESTPVMLFPWFVVVLCGLGRTRSRTT